MPFPLPLIPELSYKTAGRKFGAPRDGGKRKHAGCDLIAKLGTEIDSMLHFELYSGQAFGELTQRNNGAFQRRSDLVDPTDLLDKLALEFRAAHPSGAKS